jgi:hypothetical protein
MNVRESIWKYDLQVEEGMQSIEMPRDAKILTVGAQGQTLCIWAEVVQSNAKEIREFMVLGTGWELPPDHNYIGTVQIPPYVWHIFENRRTP